MNDLNTEDVICGIGVIIHFGTSIDGNSVMIVGMIYSMEEGNN